MDEATTQTSARERHHPVGTGGMGLFGKVWHALVALLDALFDSALYNMAIMWREFDLFFGATLFFCGLFGFSPDKFCDGNTADYLSCTRPTAYYHYDALHITLIVVGATFILLWFLKKSRAKVARA